MWRLLPLLALIACAPQGPQAPQTPLPPPGADPGACGAGELGRRIGQPASVLAGMTFPAGTRFIRPGDAITEDYSPTRTNIDIDARGIITRVWCG